MHLPTLQASDRGACVGAHTLGTEWHFGTIDDSDRHHLSDVFSYLGEITCGTALALVRSMYEQEDQLSDLFDGIDAAESWEYATDEELDCY